MNVNFDACLKTTINPSLTALQWGHRLSNRRSANSAHFRDLEPKSRFGWAKSRFGWPLGRVCGPPGPQNITRGASGGSWVCFRRLIDVFGHFRWNYHEFSSVLHGYRHFHSTVRCCCGRQSPKVKNLKIRGFEHFFSPASDRFGRLSSRFRALLGWIKKNLVLIFRYFFGL